MSLIKQKGREKLILGRNVGLYLENEFATPNAGKIQN